MQIAIEMELLLHVFTLTDGNEVKVESLFASLEKAWADHYEKTGETRSYIKGADPIVTGKTGIGYMEI
jgi:hypothetical protein